MQVGLGCGDTTITAPGALVRAHSVCQYAGGEFPFQFTMDAQASYVLGQTVDQFAAIAGIDAWDADGHSLAGIDTFTFEDGVGHYFLGDPFAATVPEPTSLALLLPGIAGLLPIVRRRHHG